MNAAAIEYIWQAIQESERSDELQFMDALNRLSQQRPDRSGAIGRESITAAVTEPLRTHRDSLPMATLPLLPRP